MIKTTEDFGERGKPELDNACSISKAGRMHFTITHLGAVHRNNAITCPWPELDESQRREGEKNEIRSEAYHGIRSGAGRVLRDRAS